MLYIQVGDNILAAVLEDNPSARALAALLEEGPVTLEAENYGGFEKVGELPEALPQNDTRITAAQGDVMLYRGDSVVLFYGSNTWSYTKLARITDAEGLETALSGSEISFTLSLWP
ncbi:cyclophilin-like fold protein [Candidatus Allofournierella excrementigallinarum]|uniref:cyclophilin-like fold protein n=1 Tax=Candidatus Allofournierella excrementigallinarum TaxID=2838592 RepID=UPI00374F7D12